MRMTPEPIYEDHRVAQRAAQIAHRRTDKLAREEARKMASAPPFTDYNKLYRDIYDYEYERELQEAWYDAARELELEDARAPITGTAHEQRVGRVIRQLEIPSLGWISDLDQIVERVVKANPTLNDKALVVAARAKVAEFNTAHPTYQIPVKCLVDRCTGEGARQGYCRRHWRPDTEEF